MKTRHAATVAGHYHYKTAKNFEGRADVVGHPCIGHQAL